MLQRRRFSVCLALALLGLTACAAAGSTDATDVVSDAGPPRTSQAAEAPSDTATCAAMTRTGCMQSTSCTLERDPATGGRYRCRAATEPCESGLAQAGFHGSGEGIVRARAQQQQCNDRLGCAYSDSGCYCACAGHGETRVPDGAEAELCQCECSNGEPPSCVAIS